MRYYVYRTGYAPNNPVDAGGPVTLCVAEVEAEDQGEAVHRARQDGVTCFAWQTMWAQDADAVDRETTHRREQPHQR